MTLRPHDHQPLSVTPLRHGEWAPLLDSRRLQDQNVIALLRSLAEQSIDYLHHGGVRPDLDQKQTDLLRPLTGRNAWSQRDRRRAASAMRRPVQLSDAPGDFASNEVTVLAIASTRARGWLSRRLAGLRASHAALLHADQLLHVYLEVAWSNPETSYRLMEQVRNRWRTLTLFHPDEPVWPALLSHASFHFLVAAAIRRPDPSFFAFPAERVHRHFVKQLDDGLHAAAELLAERSETEQLIVIDAVSRGAGKGSETARNLALKLPAARYLPSMSSDLATAESSKADLQPSTAEADQEDGASDLLRTKLAATFVGRLKKQQI